MFVKKLLLSKVFLLLLGTCISPTQLKAQFHVGPEIGTSISAIVPSNQKIPYYVQRVGFRAGAFAELELSNLFALRSGVFYSLRGFHFGNIPNPYNKDKFWDIHGLNIPLMLVFKLNKKIQIAVGLETNTVLGSNLPLLRIPSLQVGIRGECGFHVTERLRVAAYYMHGFNKLLEIKTNRPGQNDFYNNIVAGISLSYILKTVRKKEKIPIEICPPFL
ncbi:MAG: hypothetical protein ACI976_002857 [Aureispira sp.]|jgi:hypothetical protein